MPFDLLAMIALNLNPVIFESSARSTQRFQFLRKVFEVRIIHRKLENDRHGFSTAGVFLESDF